MKTKGNINFLADLPKKIVELESSISLFNRRMTYIVLFDLFLLILEFNLKFNYILIFIIKVVIILCASLIIATYLQIRKKRKMLRKMMLLYRLVRNVRKKEYIGE
jgi:hypothetical protein